MPMMEVELFKALKADIKNNGINDPILYWVTPAGEKLVIEGHTRLMAAIELKLKDIPQKQVNERFDNLEDIKLWMLKNQVQRRNMSKTEKLLLAYKCKETIEKAAWINISRGGKKVDVANPVDTNEEIAKIAGVGRTMVVEYTRVLNQASQTVLDKVHKGDMSISAANKTIKGDPDEPKKEKVVKVAKEPEIMMLKSVEEGTELVKSGEISAVMLVKDNDQIMKLSRKQIKMTGFYIIEFDAA
jgi:ParB family chromosome partitioning protein